MAIRDVYVAGSNGVGYTKEVTSSADYAALPNDTYFKDLSLGVGGLVLYKDPSGTVLSIFSAGNPGTVTSVGLSMPSAFSVANSPVTGSGSIAVTGAGTTAEYVRGDGSLSTFPTVLPSEVIQQKVKLDEAIPTGYAVYVYSADGTNILVRKASNNSEATSSKTLGLLLLGGAINLQTTVITNGKISGLDTSATTIGAPVWLGVNGQLIYGLANKPVAPAHLVYIGVVTRVNSNNGEIFVNIQNGFEVDELHDVTVVGRVNNSLLGYNSSTSLHEFKTVSGWLGYTPVDTSIIGVSNGLATLDAGGKIPVTQLPSSIMNYHGTYDIVTNTPALSDGMVGADPGDVYICNTAGTRTFGPGNTITVGVGDWLIYSQSNIWEKSSNSDAVISVNGYTGAVSLSVSDISGAIGGSGTTNYLTKYTGANTIGDNSLLYDTGSRIGLGITTPNALFHITNTSTSNSFLVDDDTNPDSTPFVIDNTGRVGIGTLNPSTKLHVVGDGMFNFAGETVLRLNNTLLNSTSTTGITGIYLGDASSGINMIQREKYTANTTALAFYGEFGYNTQSLLAKFSYSESEIRNAGIRRFYINGNGDTSIGNNITPNAKLHVNNTTAANSFLVEDDTNPDASPFVIDNAGNVGIGTLTPTAPLHVNVIASLSTGETLANFTVSDDPTSNLKISNNTGTDAVFIPNIFSTGSHTSQALRITANTLNDTVTTPIMTFDARKNNSSEVSTRPLFSWTNYGTDKMIMNSLGYLGIGKAPEHMLDVLGTIRVGNTSTYASTINQANIASITSEFIPVTGPSYVRFRGHTGSAGNVHVMSIGGHGRIGINIQAPTATLHVTNTGATDSFLIEDETNPDSTPFVINNAGSVGIGTLTPATKLDVNGDVKISTIANATTNTNKILVSDGGVIKYRTATETISDILTVTTIGSSGPATLTGTTLNIPQYTGGTFDYGMAYAISTQNILL